MPDASVPRPRALRLWLARSTRRSARVVEDMGRLKTNEPAVGACEQESFGTSFDRIAAGNVPELDALVPTVPVLATAERTGHTRIAASQKVEDAFHGCDPAGARISQHVI